MKVELDGKPDKRLKRKIDGAKDERGIANKDCYTFHERIERSQKYEKINLKDGASIKRLMVPGGWIVRLWSTNGVAGFFYPDKYHSWQPGNDPVWIEEEELQKTEKTKPRIENRKPVYTFDLLHIDYISVKYPGKIVLKDPAILSIGDIVSVNGRICEVTDVLSGTTFTVEGV